MPPFTNVFISKVNIVVHKSLAVTLTYYIKHTTNKMLLNILQKTTAFVNVIFEKKSKIN